MLSKILVVCVRLQERIIVLDPKGGSWLYGCEGGIPREDLGCMYVRVGSEGRILVVCL